MFLLPRNHKKVVTMLREKNKVDLFKIPTGKEVVYNDDSYSFALLDSSIIPSTVYINDEAYDTYIDKENIEGMTVFKLRNCDKPFLQSYGAIRVEFDVNNNRYCSNSIAVMVSNNNINKNVLNMVQFIYNNCEEYLYEEHKYSSILSGVKENEIISLEAKINFLQDILDIYKKSYQYLKNSPHSKLEKSERVDSFDKLQSVSQRTIQYIINHVDELTPANYDTGIKYNNQYYQPNRILVEYSSYSYDIYENKIIVGFLKTIIFDIGITINDLQKKEHLKDKMEITEGYINSVYKIFSKSIEKLTGYVEILKSLKNEYQRLYYFYFKLFDISVDIVRTVPIFTSVFRSINAYKQIYMAIRNWFSIGNYDLQKDELLLSFVSTSKIYEYYCLVKLLRGLTEDNTIKMVRSDRITYNVRNKYYNNTKTNNTFYFKKGNIKITVYFQPVIYGDNRSINGITLFRNTSSSSRNSGNKGSTYTPDYILKFEYNHKNSYIIIDAKFSTPDNVRIYQLQELVYKYLFSISPLNKKDDIIGLYILCGKKEGFDEHDVVHDLAQKIKYLVKPFAEILIISGANTNDFTMIKKILDNIDNFE